MISFEQGSSRRLVIAFTGHANALHLPTKEFFVQSGLNNDSKIIIHDPSRLKTLNGLGRHLPTFYALTNFLKRQIIKIAPEELLLVGTSNGGHSALLFGHLLKADRVVAFSPLPYLSAKQCEAMADPLIERNRDLAAQFESMSCRLKRYLDLRPVLSNWNGVTNYDVHVASDNRWDCRRAAYLDGCPNLRVIRHSGSGQLLAARLGEAGQLQECFHFDKRSSSARYTRSIYVEWNEAERAEPSPPNLESAVLDFADLDTHPFYFQWWQSRQKLEPVDWPGI